MKWFLIVFFKVFMVLFLLIKKKNIAVIINASTSSSLFHFGSIEAEDILQSFMFSLFHRLLLNVFKFCFRFHVLLKLGR